LSLENASPKDHLEITDPLESLQAQPFFRELSQQERKAFMDQAISKKLEPNGFLNHQGEVWPYLVYVLEGQLRWMMLASTGRTHVLTHVEENGLFWAHSIFDEKPMPASLQARVPAKVLLWHRDDILPILMANSAAMWQVTRSLVRLMRRAREIIYGLSFQPVFIRLADFLLEQMRAEGAGTISRDYTLEEMAGLLGTSPEVVCRMLYRFQEDGLIKVDRTSFAVVDRDGLRKVLDRSQEGKRQA
jgi:CRP/FNR family transcriptional regulator